MLSERHCSVVGPESNSSQAYAFWLLNAFHNLPGYFSPKQVIKRGMTANSQVWHTILFPAFSLFPTYTIFGGTCMHPSLPYLKYSCKDLDICSNLFIVFHNTHYSYRQVHRPIRQSYWRIGHRKERIEDVLAIDDLGHFSVIYSSFE